MAQGLAAEQHGRLVQLPAGLVLPAGINLALVAVPRPLVYPVIGDLIDGTGMGFINGRGVLGPVRGR